jgi:hypothetical protein
MPRTTRPAFESLEGRALLSSATPGLAVSISTDRASYQAGQPVVILFTETNVGKHDVSVSHGPSVDGFVARRGGKDVWRSNAGLNPMSIRVDVLHPGQSHTIRATWDGRSDLLEPGRPSVEGPPLAGTFEIRKALARGGPIVRVTIAAPTSPAPPPISPASPTFTVSPPETVRPSPTFLLTRPITPPRPPPHRIAPPAPPVAPGI